jgi:2-polyprenyl-3-methyl-5-hydroxy-6-metoxy-1,4-benzoquinol methylase
MREDASRSLEPVRQVFEALGRHDPMWTALSRSECRGNKWDPEAFFAHGRAEIAAVMTRMEGLGMLPAPGRALDFGCAVGRLTQALAGHFEQVVGVDIAVAMIDAARTLNHHGARVSYVLNTTPDLRVFPDASFDFVYTNKVLQHIPPIVQAGYIAEFMRILRPGGIAVFQTRNGPDIGATGLRAWLYTLNRRHLRRLSQRLRGRAPYEMHFIARNRVEQIVAEGGGRVVDVVDMSRRKTNLSLRYCAVKGSAAGR